MRSLPLSTARRSGSPVRLAEEQSRLAVQVESRHASDSRRGAAGLGRFGACGGHETGREMRRANADAVATSPNCTGRRPKGRAPEERPSHASVPGRAAGMPHHLVAAVGVQEQAAGVAELPAVVQLCRFLKLFGDERAETAVRQRVVPDEEVARRAEQDRRRRRDRCRAASPSSSRCPPSRKRGRGS